MRYPRNMQGYGGRPPAADWPGGAKRRGQFVLNYEEGGENCVLHGDAASEAFLSEIAGAQPWPGQRHWNMESIYEYGARAGFWRLRDLFVSRGVPVTVYGVATALARSPAQVAAMQEAGWEIASHGLKWIDYRDHTREAEARRHRRGHPPAHRGHRRAPARLVHRPLLGQHRRPRHRGGRLRLDLRHLRRRPALLARACRPPAADHPLHASTPTTCASRAGRASTPATSSSPTSRTASTPSTPRARPARPKMLSVGLHCRLVGRPGRVAGLARFIDYVQAHDGVWIATRIDIARHWAQPPPGAAPPADRPSTLDRDAFVAALRRRLRALALDRRARPRPRARPGARHRRRPRQRARPRLPLRLRGRAPRRPHRPPRPRRQARRGQAPDRRIRPPSRPAPASTR